MSMEAKRLSCVTENLTVWQYARQYKYHLTMPSINTIRKGRYKKKYQRDMIFANNFLR
jgi:hypothetical protein